MRIVAGIARGRPLAAPKGRHTRPTSDRVKEALFSIIAAYVVNARVLDLFAGSGALGLEALSRGATSAVFVDHDAVAIRCIEKNRDATGLGPVRVIRRTVTTAVRQLAEGGEQFDLIFCDPPYAENLAVPVLEAVEQGGLLAVGGILVVEHRAGDVRVAQWETTWTRWTERRYGETGLTLFRRDEQDLAGASGRWGNGMGGRIDARGTVPGKL